MNPDHHKDVIIIGGSFAGLAAALALGRSLRKTLIIDNQTPANRFTPHSHNLITHDGKPPAEIASLAKKDLEQYTTINLLNDQVTAIQNEQSKFSLSTKNGQIFTARKILFATGIHDVLPATTGFAECWGKSILHCPYCHGYEYRGQPTGIFASGETAFEFAKMISHWTRDLHILTDGEAGFDKDQTEHLRRNKIAIHSQKVQAFTNVDGYLHQVIFTDGNELNLEAVYARPTMRQQTTLPEELGCKMKDHLISIDGFQQTTVPGVYAAGDNSSMMRSLAGAIASGTFAGAAINRHLIMEDF